LVRRQVRLEMMMLQLLLVISEQGGVYCGNED